MEIVTSPITNSNATFVKELDVSAIKKKYLKELSISVDKYLSMEKISIYRCPDTGYRFYYPFTIFGDADFYYNLQKANKNYYETWKWENEQAVNHIKDSDFLLDVGCGEGLFLKEMKRKGMRNLYGIDFAIQEGMENKEESIHIENIPIEKFCRENPVKFDVVTCFQVLEHISDVRKFIENVLYCLKPNGKLIIAVPNSNPYLYVHDLYHTLNLPPHHAGLWDKQALQKLSNYFPLDVVFTSHQPIGLELDYYVEVQMDYLYNKSLFSKIIFDISIFKMMYRKYLYLIKNRIEGHSQIAVYKKK